MDTVTLLEQIRDDISEKFDADPYMRMVMNLMIGEFITRTKKERHEKEKSEENT